MVFACSPRKLGPETLLYLGSRDGFSNVVFHKRCDLVGPTVTIVSTGDGRIFGGYAHESWLANAPGRYGEDHGAFLFLLTDGTPDRPPEKLSQTGKSPEDAVFYDCDLG
ncbi:hypothetical protein T484DRAFT_1803801 [Baffinella frigidus]|nr:hypothetical protein T484DRAFT_1803801 [Cryptophyta sp. CCMP2293]